MTSDLQDLMREATRLTQAGQLTDATAIIQRALNGGAAPRSYRAAGPAMPSRRSPTSPPFTPFTPPSPWVLDGCVFELDETRPATSTPAPTPASTTPQPAARADTENSQLTPAPDTFTSGQHSHARLTRRFKLYVPPAPLQALQSDAKTLRPLVLMLHGCTQNADDFAAGTAMNELARVHGFFVLYPEQSADANSSRCWNWFKHNHQQRGRGEPALLASLTQTVMQHHAIDPQRVFVAGLSAGGAMAAVMAEAYPELFAAAGVHSGLPSGAARNLPEALAAMKGGAAPREPLPAQPTVPTIVFHGDQDGTVHPKNGELLIAAQTASPAATCAEGAASRVRVEAGVSKQGRRYTRQIHEATDGSAVAEHWVVHGAGHAWSGGNASGSYTDASGPDASAEMLRFFLAHPRPARG